MYHKVFQFLQGTVQTRVNANKKEIKQLLFQFLQGTVQTASDLEKSYIKIRFQFLQGTVQTMKKEGLMKLRNGYFNSSKVRYKLTEYVDFDTLLVISIPPRYGTNGMRVSSSSYKRANFNSSKVRYKLYFQLFSIILFS